MRLMVSGGGWAPVLCFTILAVSGAGMGADDSRAKNDENLWAEQGPQPIFLGQPEEISQGSIADPEVGAVHALAPHPTNANILYVGTVNGGIWKTTNARSRDDNGEPNPTWVAQTDDQASLSISDIDFDSTDNSHQTLVAGVGGFSSFSRIGGDHAGLLRTTDGGATWNPIGSDMAGRRITAVAARGDTILASVNLGSSLICGAGADVGVFRSTDTGATFALITNGIPSGFVDAMVADPQNPAVFYASVVLASGCSGGASESGLYRSTDTGASWSKVSDATVDAVLDDTSRHVKIAAGDGRVFAAVTGENRQLAGVFQSVDGTTWSAMDLPGTMESDEAMTMSGFVGIHPGGQGGLHMSLVVDPTDPDVVYIGGDRQPAGLFDESFPNSIGALDFSGRLFRGDAGASSGNQWTPITHNFTQSGSSPHADSRDMRFDVEGNLLQADDGGVYERTLPRSSSGDWLSLNGNLQITEMHSAAYDGLADVAVSGNQDNGSTFQRTIDGLAWEVALGGDGGDSAIDDSGSTSLRYLSRQFLSGFRRLRYDANNNHLDTVFPNLTVVSGDSSYSTQFVTPMELNSINPDRILFGMDNSLYESLDGGDTISEVGVGIDAISSGLDTIGYGAQDNENVIYVGGCKEDCFTDPGGEEDGLFLRTGNGTNFSLIYAPEPGEIIQGVSHDPTDPLQAFFIEPDDVYRSTANGNTISNVNGDLPLAESGTLRFILFIPYHTNDALLVGANRGVYMTREDADFMNWSVVGSNLPNAPVFELDYDADTDTLLAATLGRGAFKLIGLLNEAPTAVDDSADTTENQTVEVDVLGNDVDFEGAINAASVVVVSEPADGGTSVNPITGQVAYMPDTDFSGADSFTYTVEDDRGAVSNPATVTIDVNDRPVAVDDNAVTSEGVNVIVNVSDNDTDDDGVAEATIIIADQPDHGTALLNLNHDVIYQPEDGFIGTDTFTYTIEDVAGATSDPATVTVRVTELPVAVADDAVVVIDGSVAIDVTANDSDDVGIDAASVAVASQPDHGTAAVGPGSGEITYQPDASFTGDDSFTYTVDDTDGFTSAAGTVSIRVHAYPIAVDDSAATRRATPVDIDVLANDSDDLALDPTTVTILMDAGFGSTMVDPVTGVVTYTPGDGMFDTDQFSYTVTDVDGATSEFATVTVSVNDPPIANDDMVETNPAQEITINVVANDVDADGALDLGTLNPVQPANGHIGFGLPGEIDYTPDVGFIGTDIFTYTIDDDDGARSNTATVTVTVQNPPVANSDFVNTAQNTAVAIDVLANDDDVDGTLDPSSVQIVTAPPASQGDVAVLQTGLIEFTPATDFKGLSQFTYSVADDDGATSMAAPVTVLVNNPPTADDDQAATTRDIPIVIDVLDGDADSDGALDAASIEIVAIPGNGTAVPGPLDGEVTYTPDSGFFGSDAFAYTVADDDGTPSNPATVTIAVNNPPIAVNDDLAKPDQDTVTLDVLANDSDLDGTLVASTVRIVATPSQGVASVSAEGVVTYVPDSGFSGFDVFTYTVDDDDGATSNEATVTIAFTVPPLANDDFAGTRQAVSVMIPVLDNDSDPDGVLDPGTLMITTPAGFADTTVDAVSGVVTYTPHVGSRGLDEFRYRVRDNAGGLSNAATVSVLVNDPPLAKDDAVITDVNVAVNISVLDNDDDDSALEPKSVVVVEAPIGSAFATARGDITYDPPVDFTGTDMLTYTVNDEDGAVSNLASVTITINRAPVAVADAAATMIGAAVVVMVLENDLDDGPLDPASVKVVTPAANGATSVDVTNGAITYTPTAGFDGQDSFSYTVADERGLISNAAKVTVSVGNTPPTAMNDALRVTRGFATDVLASGEHSLLANDSDPDADPLTVSTTPVTDPLEGIVTLSGDGSFLYEAAATAGGADRFEYEVCDDGGLCDTAEVSVEILDVFVFCGNFEGTDADPAGCPGEAGGG